MSRRNEQSYWTDGSAESDIQQRDSALNRLADRFIDGPELRARAAEMARETALGVGTSAVHGALERSGVARVDDEGRVKIRKAGLVKAALRPQRTARKAVLGAVSGARTAARQEVSGLAREQLAAAGSTVFATGSPESAQIDASTSSPDTDGSDLWGDTPSSRPYDAVAPKPTEASPSPWDNLDGLSPAGSIPTTTSEHLDRPAISPVGPQDYWA